jgi:uncharacterized protein (TIGR02266 family)
MVTTGSAVPPPADEAIDLDAAERDLAAAERALEAKVVGAARQCAGMGARARQLLHFAEKNGLPPSAPACTGLKALAVPELDVGVLAQSMETRRAALESRRRALHDLEAALGKAVATTARLAELEHEVRAAVAAQVAQAPRPEVGRVRAPAGAEHRRTARVRLERVVDLSSDDNFFVGFANDVSVGGLFVATSDPPPRGALVDLVFTLPDGTRVEAEGEVRWTREYNDRVPFEFPGAGIQFKRLAPEAVTAIAHFVEEREAMFYDD